MNQEERARAAQYGASGFERLGEGLAMLDRACASSWTGAVQLGGVKMKLGDLGQLETLVILTGWGDDGTPLVAFHSSAPPSEALVGAMRRLMNGTLTWKVDGYANKGGTQGALGAGQSGVE